MIVCRTIAELKEQINAKRDEFNDGSKLGLVPTMGYLHEGHASLIRRSVEENEITALSIFVNPMQFGPNEDLDRYPRNEERDLAVAAECGADIVFIPSVQEMYTRKPLTTVAVGQITQTLCGASRPGHFDGVGIVISKLFHLFAPDRAYFGMKDAQQVAVVKQLVNDLNFQVEVVPCPIVREPDGLALSSRNVFLNSEDRVQSVVLSSTLRSAEDWVNENSSLTAGELLRKAKGEIGKASNANIDYVELLTYPELERLNDDQILSAMNKTLILALAVKFGSTRLIDNCLLYTGGGEK